MISTTKLCDLILVNYNSKNNIVRLLKSINKYASEIINRIYIVNNCGEKLDYLNKISKIQIKVVNNDKNIGFGKAINIGIKLSNKEYILLLNPDTVLIDSSIKNTLNYLILHNNVGIIGGKILDFDTKQQQLTATSYPGFFTALFEFTNLKKIFKNNIFSNNFWIEIKNNNTKITEVTSLCGAYMFLRKTINNNLNLFDERYFMYMEDIDIGINNIEKNYKVIFDPSSQITHIGGASSNSKYKIVLKYWYKSRILFFKKHSNLVIGLFLNFIFKTEEYLLKIYHYITHKPNV